MLIGDQADPAFWAGFVAMRPHSTSSSTTAATSASAGRDARGLFCHINPGGVYICEDIHGEENAFHAYIDGLARQLHQMGGPDSHRFPANSLQSAIASIHSYPFVTVIEKRTRPLDVLEAPRRGTQWQPFYSSDQLGRDL